MNKLHISERSSLRRWTALILCVALGGTALAQDAAPKAAAAARAAIGAALEQQRIPQALQAYDDAAALSGPSLELLTPIARADLGYCLDKGKSWDRIEAARALALLGEERGKQALVAELRSPHSQVRTRVALLAAEGGLTEAIPGLNNGLAGREAGDAERVALARALYRLGEKEPGRSTLAQLSGSDDPRVRLQAVRALVLLDDKESLQTVRERLKDEATGTAMWAARGAARWGDAAGRKRLQEWMAGDSPSLRVQAAWHLRGAGVTDFVPAARKLAESAMEDPDDILRGLGLSVYLLSWLDPEVGQPFLERVLALEGHLDTRMMAVRRLAELRHESAPAQIRGLYQEAKGPGSASHRADLVRFAGWLGDLPQVREFLRQAAGDESGIVQLEALEMLAGLGVVEALAPLRELLAAPLLGRQIRAAEALIHFGNGLSPPPDMWVTGGALGPRWG